MTTNVRIEQHTAGRILLLVTNLTFGGAEAQVARLAHELKQRNWQVGVVSMMLPEALVAEIESKGVKVYSLGMKRGIPDPRALLRLRRLINKFKPDILHCHMFHANILGRVVRLFAHVPVVISTIHNLRETSERGGPTWYKERLYRATDALGDVTTVICKTAFDRHVEIGAVPVKRFRMIPNFVDTDRFSKNQECRQKARLAHGVEDKFVWLAVGRLVYQKDYPNLLRAVKMLNDPRIVVLVAGGGPLHDVLRASAREMGIENTVRFCGTSEDILDLYNAADGFVMSSEFEGLSVALLEATSMGLPAVVTNAGGNAEIVKNGETGYIVPCGDSHALADGMRKIMSQSAEERSSMGDRASQQCADQYHKTVVMQQLLALYAEMRDKAEPGNHSLTPPSSTNTYPGK